MNVYTVDMGSTPTSVLLDCHFMSINDRKQTPALQVLVCSTKALNSIQYLP